jgi:hypothetical protein
VYRDAKGVIHVTRVRSLVVIVAVVGPLLLGTAACGGDDKEPTATEATGGTKADDVADALDDGKVADALEDSGIDKDCVALALRVSEAFGSTASGMSSPDQFGAAAEAFDELAGDLPEVEHELETMSAALRSAADGDLDALGTDEYSAASEAVSDYFSERCPD